MDFKSEFHLKDFIIPISIVKVYPE